MDITRGDKLLLPSEICFGEGEARLMTLLGSCVAITVWHPKRKIGGMCHYMLARRGDNKEKNDLDGRYADEALELILREIKRRKTQPTEYHVKLIGGANMFSNYKASCTDLKRTMQKLCEGCNSVPCRNRQAAYKEIQKYPWNRVEEDLGGTHYRRVEFRVADGTVIVNKAPLSGLPR